MVGCCKNPVLNLPIAIGSYPFQNDIIAHPACEYYNLSTRSDISSSFQLSSSTFSNSTNQSVCSMSAYRNSAYRPLDSYINDGKLRPKKKIEIKMFPSDSHFIQFLQIHQLMTKLCTHTISTAEQMHRQTS